MRKSSERLIIFSRSTALRLCGLLGLGILIVTSVSLTKNSGTDGYTSLTKIKNDSLASVKAFREVYSVLMHPRCLNCHPKGDIPLQGDDSHIHNMLPQRGPDGRGVAAMQCINCHGATGVPGENTAPGNPHWHLPPADMKMVFEGRSAHQLAKQLIDPSRNGNKDMKALRKHAVDTLVKSGWNMGGDRELPPLTYQEFEAAWYTWIDNGAYAPAED
ncbi:MAG: hypothetical protein WBG71_13230 [Leeuwenhoekiella sp.]